MYDPWCMICDVYCILYDVYVYVYVYAYVSVSVYAYVYVHVYVYVYVKEFENLMYKSLRR